MQRYKLVVVGTAAGLVGVLAFPTHSTKLAIPSASPATTQAGASPSDTAGTGGASSSAPSSSNTTATGGTNSGATTPTTSPPTTSASRSATSSVEGFRYGDIAVKVTVIGSKITTATIVSLDETDGRSQQIDSYAIPQLERQIIAAGSVNINGVSGATFTSQAFVDAVANALQKLGIS